MPKSEFLTQATIALVFAVFLISSESALRIHLDGEWAWTSELGRVARTGGKLVTMLEFETWLRLQGTSSKWNGRKNQNGMGVKPRGCDRKQSPFRRLQAVGREHPGRYVETKLKLLNWPYVRNSGI